MLPAHHCCRLGADSHSDRFCPRRARAGRRRRRRRRGRPRRRSISGLSRRSRRRFGAGASEHHPNNSASARSVASSSAHAPRGLAFILRFSLSDGSGRTCPESWVRFLCRTRAGSDRETATVPAGFGGLQSKALFVFGRHDRLPASLLSGKLQFEFRGAMAAWPRAAVIRSSERAKIRPGRPWSSQTKLGRPPVFRAGQGFDPAGLLERSYHLRETVTPRKFPRCRRRGRLAGTQ